MRAFDWEAVVNRKEERGGVIPDGGLHKLKELRNELLEPLGGRACDRHEAAPSERSSRGASRHRSARGLASRRPACAPPGAIPSPPPGRAHTGTIGQPAKRVVLKVIESFFFIFSSAACISQFAAVSAPVHHPPLIAKGTSLTALQQV